MFDYVVHEPGDPRAKPRFLTTGVAAIVHFLILAVAIGLPILYASDELPEVPDMMAFVVEAPPPPPPPPPPAPPAAKVKEPKPTAKEIPVEKPLPKADTVAAPTEAPAEVKPETGAEGNLSTGKPAIEAGFEKGVEGGIAGGIVGGVEGAPPPPPPPPPPKQEGPVRVGGQIKAPQLAKRVNPVYPPAAQTAQVEGSIVLEAVVGKDGRVDNVRVVKGHPLLEQAAIAAVKQWQYEPLMLNGEPTSFILTVTVSFNIPR